MTVYYNVLANVCLLTLYLFERVRGKMQEVCVWGCRRNQLTWWANPVELSERLP